LQRAAVSDKSPIVRHEAAEAIYCFGGDRIEAILNQLLEDEIEDVRLTAAMSLAWRRRFMARI
jgi:HEAT repeat protein